MNEIEFKAIYKEYSRRLYNFVLWTTRSRSASDDILQNVFLNVWKCPSIPSDSIEQQRWLYRVTRNACLDFFRKSNRFTHFRAEYSKEFNQPVTDPDKNFIWAHLSELSDSDRSILYLHVKNGYTYKEIGAMMEMTENLVRVRAFRALKRLREIMVKKEL